GYAARAGRPVIFFDSHDALVGALRAKRSEVLGVFADLGEPGYPPEELTRDLEDFLLDDRDPGPRRVLNGVPAPAAARPAVELAAARPSSVGVPRLTRSPLAGRTAKFAGALRELQRRLRTARPRTY